MVIYGGCIQRGLVSSAIASSSSLPDSSIANNVGSSAVSSRLDAVFRETRVDSEADVETLIGNIAQIGACQTNGTGIGSVHSKGNTDSSDGVLLSVGDQRLHSHFTATDSSNGANDCADSSNGDFDRDDSLLSEAIVWYARAAALGHAQAACNLAIACEQRMQTRLEASGNDGNGIDDDANSGVDALPSRSTSVDPSLSSEPSRTGGAETHGDAKHALRTIVYRLYRVASARGSAAAMVNLALGLQRGEFRSDKNGQNAKNGKVDRNLAATGGAFAAAVAAHSGRIDQDMNGNRPESRPEAEGNESALAWFRRAAGLGDAQAARCVALCADADADAEAAVAAAEGGNHASKGSQSRGFQLRTAIATQWYVDFVFFGSCSLHPHLFFPYYYLFLLLSSFVMSLFDFFAFGFLPKQLPGMSALPSSATRMPCMNSHVVCATVLARVQVRGNLHLFSYTRLIAIF
jgi:TPR repeat protein